MIINIINIYLLSFYIIFSLGYGIFSVDYLLYYSLYHSQQIIFLLKIDYLFLFILNMDSLQDIMIIFLNFLIQRKKVLIHIIIWEML